MKTTNVRTFSRDTWKSLLIKNFHAHQVVIGSFLTGSQSEPKPKKQRPEFAPTFSPVPATNHNNAGGNAAVYTGPLRSITPASYRGNNASAGNYVNCQTTVAAENNFSLPGEVQTVVAAESNTLLPGEVETVVAAENNTLLPGESQTIVAAENKISMPLNPEKLSPSKCVISC